MIMMIIMKSLIMTMITSFSIMDKVIVHDDHNVVIDHDDNDHNDHNEVI